MKRLYSELKFDEHELELNSKKIKNETNNNLDDAVTIIDNHIYFVGQIEEKNNF